MVGAELAKNKQRKACARQNRQRDNEMRRKPVVFLALVQHDLQRANADRQQPNAPIVDLGTAALDVRRIEDQKIGKDEGQNANGNIDVKNPAPTVAISEPAAYDGAEHGRDHNAQRPKSHRLAAVFRRKYFQQNRL